MGDTQTRSAAKRARSTRPPHAKAAVLESEIETLRADRARFVQLLAECSILLSSYRRLNAGAGFPFRDPPRAREIIGEIDAITELEWPLKSA